MSEFIMEGIRETSNEILRTVKGIDGMIRTMTDTQDKMATAHTDIGKAFTLLTQIFERAEERQNKLESTNNDLYREKGIPSNVFFLVVGTLCGVIVLGALWITDTAIKATATSIETSRKKDVLELKSTIDESAKKIVEEVKSGH